MITKEKKIEIIRLKEDLKETDYLLSLLEERKNIGDWNKIRHEIYKEAKENKAEIQNRLIELESSLQNVEKGI